jgi:TolB-like protein/tetratricopeptide (TPR) repeat protein
MAQPDERASATADPAPGLPVYADRYMVQREIGSGGMGRVFLAHDLRLSRDVAIKVLFPGPHDERQLRRFEHEARAAGSLNHPNIVDVHDIGDHDGEPYIVTEFLRGDTLRERLRRGALPAEEAMGLAVQLAQGLVAAHEHGIVHRDLKPANLFLAEEGRLKILDFGIAQLPLESAGQRSLESGAVFGTVSYMSPEQVRGRTVDARSDLFAFGAVLHEMVSGAPPFDRTTPLETAHAILDEDAAPLPASAPRALVRTVERCLRKDPAERFQTAREVVAALGALRLGAPARLRRRVTIVAALLFVTAVAGALAVRWRLVTHAQGRAGSIAVLPFASLSDQDNAYLADAIHDELLRKLIEIGDLSVISRTSVMQYKSAARNLREIGEALGVSSIVEGSVQRVGNRVRVQAKLVDARTDRQMWADRYDREVTDVFAIEAAVAEEIANALKARLSPAQTKGGARRPTDNPDAYELYLRGVAYESRAEPKDAAIAEFSYRQAIEKDPTFALARAHLAKFLVGRYWFRSGTPKSVIEEVAHQAREAVRLQPDLPEAHLALGAYYFWSRREYERALSEFEIARAGDPNSALKWIAIIQRRQGRYDESIRNMEQLARLDPRSSSIPHLLAQSFIWLRRYGDAEHAIQRALTLAPDSDDDLVLMPFLYELWKGDTAPAKAFLRDVPKRLDTWARVGGERDNSLILDEFGYWLVMIMTHNPPESLRVLDSVKAESLTTHHAIYPKAILYADAHAALGDAARARAEYQAALPMLEAEVREDPDHPFQRCLLAHAYAALGRKEDALREARRSAEILPLSKDAYFGSKLLMEIAMVEGRVGETTAAIDHIRDLLKIPVILSSAMLRIDPRWASLREDKRFRGLAEMDLPRIGSR